MANRTEIFLISGLKNIFEMQFKVDICVSGSAECLETVSGRTD